MPTEFSRNLKALMTQLSITSAQLAKTLNVDPSLISRWLRDGCGARKASQHALAIGEYVASRRLSPENRAWLCAALARVEGSGVSPERIALWLYPRADLPAPQPSTDSEGDFSNLLVLKSFRDAVAVREPAASMPPSEPAASLSVCRGSMEIAALLHRELFNAKNELPINLFLTSEAIESAVDAQIISVIHKLTVEKRLNVRVLVQSANNSAMSSRLVGAYMPLLVLGRLSLSIVQGTPQTFTASMNIIIPGRSAIIVTEAVQKSSPAFATIIREPELLSNMMDNFESTLRFARPLMTAYDDSFARNIIEAFFEEYGRPGSLDVIKCGLNPMYMSVAQYGKVIEKFGHRDEQYRWRLAEFTRFKAAMDDVLATSRFREVLSLPKLRRIALEGRCRMPSMYFMDAGVWYLDAADCVDMLSGYIRYLETCPSFQLLLVEDESLFSENSCWHIKSNKHVMIHSWNVDHPIMVYSDQLLLIDEFQRHFDHIWEQISAAGTSKRRAIEILTTLRTQCAAHL